MKFRVFLVFFSLSICSVYSNDVICFEAENYISKTAPIKSIDAKDASKKVLSIAQGAGEGKKVGGDATYKFEVNDKGRYIIWARVFWLDSCGNSFDISVNGGPKFTFGNNGTYKKWHWVKSKVKIKLKKGKTTLKIFNREDGIQIDQFFITKDRYKVPVGIESTF